MAHSFVSRLFRISTRCTPVSGVGLPRFNRRKGFFAIHDGLVGPYPRYSLKFLKELLDLAQPSILTTVFLSQWVPTAISMSQGFR